MEKDVAVAVGKGEGKGKEARRGDGARGWAGWPCPSRLPGPSALGTRPVDAAVAVSQKKLYKGRDSHVRCFALCSAWESAKPIDVPSPASLHIATLGGHGTNWVAALYCGLVFGNHN
nr:unnamed protein product [Digitaria exilis]